MPKYVTCEHLQNLRRDDLPHVIVDVRDPLEFEAGHIVDSINVPKRELTDNIANLLPDKAKRVIVIAGTTDEAEFEAMHVKLEALGYGQVEFLSGGFDAWCEISPVELEPDLVEMTPEEEGATGSGDDEVGPEANDNEPIY